MKSIFIILAIFGISCSLIVFVFFKTMDNEVLSGDFFRRVLKPGSRLVNVFSIPPDSYLAGMYHDTIFLGNRIKSDSIRSLNYITGESRFYFLPDPLHRITKSIVRYPNILRVDEENNSITRIDLNGTTQNKVFALPNFTDAIIIHPGLFAFRSFNNSQDELQLSKMSEGIVKRFPELLQKQVDGILCTDGILTYNEQQQRIFYTYYYRNQFLCMDTSMNLLFRGKTIDSISHIKIKIAIMHGNKGRKLGSPSRVVNRYSHSSDSLLYIISEVVGKSEVPDDHRKGSMIDCYSTQDGLYHYSLYLPNYKNQKLKQFVLHGSVLIALYRNVLVVYYLF